MRRRDQPFASTNRHICKPQISISSCSVLMAWSAKLPILVASRNTQLEQRIVRTAESYLAEQHHVGFIDVLVGTGFLSGAALAAWRQGRIPNLEHDLQVGADKLLKSIQYFDQWIQERGLVAREVRESRPARE